MSEIKAGGRNTPKKGEQGFQPSKEGKKAPTSITVPVTKRGAKNDPKVVAEELQKAFDKLDKEVDASADIDDATAKRYEKLQKQLDDALIATLPDTIASLKLGELVNHTYLLSGDPAWEGARVEAKLSESSVTEELIEKFKKGSFTTEPEDPNDPAVTFTLISIVKSEKPEEFTPITDDEYPRRKNRQE